MTRPKLLDSVELKRAFPDFKLRAGDVGVVVELLESDGLLVEFVDDDGETVALIDLADSDVKLLPKPKREKRQHAAPLPPGLQPYVAAGRQGRSGSRRQ